MKSWKIGALAGLIAGIITVIVYLLYLPISFQLGLVYWVPPPPETPFIKIATIEFIIGLTWGTILGILYSKVHNVIPGNNISKGFIFGLFYYIIYFVRFAVIFLPYAMYNAFLSYVISGFPYAIIYGITLGICFGFLRDRYSIHKKRPKIVVYNATSGIYPGAFAGLLGGLASFISYFTILFTGFFELIPLELIDTGFILGQLGSQTLNHLIWGTLLGIIYTKVYNLVPGKGVIKGLVYSLITVFLITEANAIAYDLAYGLFDDIKGFLFVGGAQAIVYGLALGYLYKK